MSDVVRPSIPLGSRGRIAYLVAVLVSIALMVGTITYTVFGALGEVAENADRLDDARTGEALRGALNAGRTQLQTTVQDYAFWADAATHVYAGNRAWIGSNIGVSSSNPDLFDTVMVVKADGDLVDAYANGMAMPPEDARPMIDAARPMIAAASRIDEDAELRTSSYLRHGDKVWLAALAGIHDPESQQHRAPSERRYLVAFRAFDQRALATLSRLYLISGLSLHAPDARLLHHIDVFGPTSAPVAKLSWTSRAPGSASYRAVRPTVLFALVSVALFLVLLLVTAIVAIRRVRLEERAARHLSETDRLSGLLNRAGFFRKLDRRVAIARIEKSDIVMVYLDLDGFKLVNDSYGHGVGDQLIQAVAEGLRRLTPADALLARLGGDEFALAVKTRESAATASRLSSCLLAFFSEPFVLDERAAVVGASIGIAFSEAGAVSADELVRRSDLAMYQAKEGGRGRAIAYDASMDADRMANNALELDLGVAIERGELEVAFQPVVHARNHRVSGVEALARWTRPGHGPVPPDVFIPIAEKSGLIGPLGLDVLRRALRAAAGWGEIGISVNVSPGQLRNPSFPEEVARALAAEGVAPHRLTLELTEGYLIQNPGKARDAIARLRALGVGIALDDFGAGFSSVGYLRQFGFSRMKIDRTLVAALQDSAGGREMLHATVALARSLDIPVTAEGIERADDAVILELCGCDELQGYLFGRPMNEADMAAIIAADRRPVPAMA